MLCALYITYNPLHEYLKKGVDQAILFCFSINNTDLKRTLVKVPGNPLQGSLIKLELHQTFWNDDIFQTIDLFDKYHLSPRYCLVKTSPFI